MACSFSCHFSCYIGRNTNVSKPCMHHLFLGMQAEATVATSVTVSAPDVVRSYRPWCCQSVLQSKTNLSPDRCCSARQQSLPRCAQVKERWSSANRNGFRRNVCGGGVRPAGVEGVPTPGTGGDKPSRQAGAAWLVRGFDMDARLPRE